MNICSLRGLRYVRISKVLIVHALCLTLMVGCSDVTSRRFKAKIGMHKADLHQTEENKALVLPPINIEDGCSRK